MIADLKRQESGRGKLLSHVLFGAAVRLFVAAFSEREDFLPLTDLAICALQLHISNSDLTVC